MIWELAINPPSNNIMEIGLDFQQHANWNLMVKSRSKNLSQLVVALSFSHINGAFPACILECSPCAKFDKLPYYIGRCSGVCSLMYGCVQRAPIWATGVHKFAIFREDIED